ncbi:hypothetical protein AVEN_66204-1 [Araneus ventricosus]|uniref:Mutator-like transposase domain-containing protein n=1 Tax=Araneus ventricosus TaxID=182803 RepID=A0A4Y2D1C4_ARAVE|nr:hypothetical protein AVEN_66204-1 [Araneus ventricosus]
MPRSTRIFKKRSAENTGKGVLNSIIDVNILCEYTHEFSSSDFHEGTQIATVNTRYVYALCSIGKGAEAGRMFCEGMNLPQPPTRFQNYNKRLLNATRAVCESTIQKAAKEAIVENNSDNNITVAVDGTWQKRGYMSHIGVVTVTSMDTGKVIDIDVLSKYCACKNNKNYETSCKSNFRGSSDMMKVKGACNIFKLSLTFHNARYTKYLEDGDSKAFEAIAKENIYGDEFQVEKLECIGHVMKRMGSRLRRLKEKMKEKVSSDGKRLLGKNRLTDSQIDKIQNYYGLAIRRNLNCVQAMSQAIRAIFMHKLSTDENPQHGFCPIGEDSWCGFKKAEATGSAYKHKNNLPVAVVESMRPVFRDLSHPDLLKKCVHGNTQNPNESVNNVIWSRVPKSTFVQIEALSLGVYDAVCTFNEGNSARLQILQNLGIEPGEYTLYALKCLDKEKLLRAKYAFFQQ